ncbi:polysaccharide lyase family 26 protein [Aspergillus brunneoviolaceus CBS 621.78]|uniref:Uncharacterized protein n=1 Tax=Aspergillus brunneoviolaceus CBS 621.78 TaxID=1450534 RepID=A0ACD1FZY1_9EURO|nr:hypothetical protein BO95DRAFT_475830 [Aspergillus brunneoviolaceus CBS 621.78]RAH42555.1 hypothetical protein BO95DRAFT_475830 [Aspergillus brunneoviolaceus CBS 621.78]
MPSPNLRWLTGDNPDALATGLSFTMPWPKGRYQPSQTFSIETDVKSYPLDSRELAYWTDGSLKWTAHSISGHAGYSSGYTVKAATEQEIESRIWAETTPEHIIVSTKIGLSVRFPTQSSPTLFENISLDGQQVSSAATVVSSINNHEYRTVVHKSAIENLTWARAVVKVSGHVVYEGSEHLPFDVRVYLYSDAQPLKVVFSFIHDLHPEEPLNSLGLRFSVPFRGIEHYNRHIRFIGPTGGILREEVQGLSGLWHGPSMQNRIDQTAGRTVTLTDAPWLSSVPSWNDYTLSQLSPDGFTLKKRTKQGRSWVKVTGGSRYSGIAYIGSAQRGGLAVGMTNFWEQYPTQIDLSNLTTDKASTTIWMYSPLAEPLNTHPYHDGLGLDTYEEQLKALKATYEDYEPGFGTANGIGRTAVFFLRPYSNGTPSDSDLSAFSALVRDPPRLLPTSETIYKAGVFHGTWAPDTRLLGLSPTATELNIEHNLNTLFTHYQRQVEQHRWYGFWDYGDVQHTYDPHRHAWRYDVGGFAWDNSELSTDLWLWLYFLHSGRADVFRMAEAMTRHTSEVDVYHSGRFKGFGTRHGVQHFSDSCKQLRISNVLYRRFYYYLTGDERTGVLIAELQDCQHALLGLDAHRKVQQHGAISEGFALTDICLDGGALAASWLTAWERREPGWTEGRDRLLKMLEGIANLEYGIATKAILLHTKTGEVRTCPPPTRPYAISHLSMLFGFPELVSELVDYAESEHPAAVDAFLKAYLTYCRSYNGGADVQREEYGFEFPATATWRQSHSTLTAFAARRGDDAEIARAAWQQFFETDGYTKDHQWTVTPTAAPTYFSEGEEAPWITTNEAARYGVSAIFNLANIRKYLD